MRRGSSWEEVFEGYFDGAQEARELHGVEVRSPPTSPAPTTSTRPSSWFDTRPPTATRGVGGVGLGGPEVEYPPSPFERIFRLAHDSGLAAVPHAGEIAGVDSIRDSLAGLRTHRIRHGIRAVDDPGLVRELADRRTVFDVCPISNLRLGAVRSLEEHPLPDLVTAGVVCSLSTDGPLAAWNEPRPRVRDRLLPWPPTRDFYEAGLEGALCVAETRERLRSTGEAFAWNVEDSCPNGQL